MNFEIDELKTDTPFIKVDLDVLERNINRVAKLSKDAGVKLRPHTKTHKSPDIAKLQLDAGASGVTVAKLGEAEILSDYGVNDILIAFPIIGKNKLNRFSKLLNKANLTVSLDDYQIAKGLNEVGESHDKKINVYIDVDTGLERMGRPPEESISHILKISELPFINIKGVMSHTGHAYLPDDIEETKDIAIRDAKQLYFTKELLEEKGVHISEISIGASATIRFLKDLPYVTEARPGMYVFNDRMVMGAGGATEADCAATIFATVIAKPSNDRLLIDAGSKTLAKDTYKGGGHGIIKGHDNLTISNLSEEHGIVSIEGRTNLVVGDVVEIIPNHICPVINLADHVYGVRNGVGERIIPIKARGKNR